MKLNTSLPQKVKRKTGMIEAIYGHSKWDILGPRQQQRRTTFLQPHVNKYKMEHETAQHGALGRYLVAADIN